MKKKFTNGLLFVALFLGCTSTMISCKDYDEEKVGDLQGIVADNDATLRQLLAAQKTELEAQIDALKAALATCQADCKNKQDALDAKFNEYLTISAFNTFQDELGNKYYTKEQVDANFYKKEEINQLFTNYYTQAQVDALLDDIRQKINGLASVETIINLLSDGQSTLSVALQQFFINDPVINEYLKNNAGVSLATVDSIVNSAVVTVNARIDEVAKLAQQADSLAKANSIRIDGLQGVVDGLTKTVATLTAQMDSLTATANEALALAKKNSSLVASLQSTVDGLGGDILALNTIVSGINGDINALREKIYNDSIAADKAHKEMLETLIGLAQGIEANTQTIGELRAEMDALKADVNAKLDELQKAVDAAKAAASTSDVALQKVLGIFDNVMAKFITGIEINEAYNPLFGGFNLPFDVRSNVLVAFHGTLGTRGLQFPTDDEAFYALPASHQWDLITPTDIEMIGGSLEKVPGYVDIDYDKAIVARDGAVGNAGVLYVTINPTDRDFTGTEFQLVNSRNEQSLVKLSDLAPSNHLVEFGYTRAAVESSSPNGFYEAKATLAAEDAESVRMNLSLSSLKDVASELKNYQDGINLTRTVSSLYKSLNGILPAQAVKATWTDSLGQKSVISQYAIAATTVRPLSYAFGKDLNFDKIPGVTRIEDFLDDLVEKVFAGFPSLRTDRFDIERIELDEITDDLTATFHLFLGSRKIVSSGPKTITINVPNITLTGQNGEKYTITSTKPTVTVTITGNDAEIVINYNIADAAAAMGHYTTEPVENIKAQLVDFLNDVNKFIADLKKISVETIKNNITEEIADFFEELNARYKKYMNPTKFLQPALLVKANGGYSILSESANVTATVNSKQLLLVPTTYNAEVLSPAYKKYVAVTNVSKGTKSAKAGDATCRAILDKANAQNRINQVIDGGHDSYLDFAAEGGYTYEILYSAVDYSGKVVTKKFYFTVAE